jgi:hypothetical protein
MSDNSTDCYNLLFVDIYSVDIKNFERRLFAEPMNIINSIKINTWSLKNTFYLFLGRIVCYYRYITGFYFLG